MANNPINLKKSTVQGLEIELQTSFQLMPVPRFLKGVVFTWNFSKLSSETYFPQYRKTYSHFDLTTFKAVYKDSTSLRKGAIPGQAETLMNVAVGYDVGGFSARLSMFKQGESVNVIGSQKEHDTYNRGFTRWDLSIKQRLSGSVDAYVNIVNLTGADDMAYQFVREKDTAIQDYGMGVDVGMQIQL